MTDQVSGVVQPKMMEMSVLQSSGQSCFYLIRKPIRLPWKVLLRCGTAQVLTQWIPAGSNLKLQDIVIGGGEDLLCPV